MDRTQLLDLVAKAKKINVWASHARIFLRVPKSEFLRAVARRDRSEPGVDQFYNPTKVHFDHAGNLWVS